MKTNIQTKSLVYTKSLVLTYLKSCNRENEMKKQPFYR